MSLKPCTDISEAVSFEPSLGLYLKPISKIKINVQLPKLNSPGKSITSWHVMEKLKETVKPDTFLYLKSLKITATVIKFEGELETKSSCARALARLQAAGSLKLSGFSERLQIRAAHATCNGPARHDWESFFRDAKGVNEMKPGERPDTIHLEEVPLKWFTESKKSLHPSENLLRKAFGTFGKIRRLEIPPKTTSESSMFGKTSSLHNDLLFEVYIQYEAHVEFVIAMESLRGKKLLFKEPDGKVYSTDIKVDFDRTNYLSEKCIQKRAAEANKASAVSLSENSRIHVKDNQQPIPPKLKPQTVEESLPVTLKVKTQNTSKDDVKEIAAEAQLLLRELLRRAEKSEHCKEKQKKVSHVNFQLENEEYKLVSGKDPTSKEKHVRHKTYNGKQIKDEDKNQRLHKEVTSNIHNSEKKVSQREVKMQEKRKKEKHEKDKKRKKEKRLDKTKEDRREKHVQMRMEEKTIKEKLSQVHDQERKNKEKLLEQERILKEKLLRNLKAREEEKLKVREELRKELAGHKVLKSVLANTNNVLP